ARLCEADDELDERMPRRRLVGVAAREDSHGGIGCELTQLLLDAGHGLTRDRAPLPGQETPRGEARELLPALDQRRVHGCRAGERVPPTGLQTRLEPVERDEDRAHLR